MYWIFGITEGEPDGSAIGPFDTAEVAAEHAQATWAEWADWNIGRVEVVREYRYEEV